MNDSSRNGIKTTLSLFGLVGAVSVGTLALWFTLSDRVDARVEAAKQDLRAQIVGVQNEMQGMRAEVRDMRGMIYQLNPDLFTPAFRPRVRQWQDEEAWSP